MENILHDFNKKITTLMESYLKNLIFENGISKFTDDLVKKFAEFGSSLTQFLIKYVEEEVFRLEERKEQFNSLEKDCRNIVSIFGEISFKRRYYEDKKSKEKVYLLDKIIEIEPKRRLLQNVREKLIDEAIEGLKFEEFTNICYEILSEEMEKSVRERKEKLMMYIINNIEGITNLYKNKEILHGCSAEGHVSHIFSARMSSRPMGWKTENVNNMSKLRLLREDNITTKEILNKQAKVINLEEYKQIKEKVKKKINKSIDFRPASIPLMTFGMHEEKEYFKNLLSFKAV